MTDFTPERLAQIKARIEALPRGSWKFTAESPDDRTTAEFFDAARQDIPDLIAALEAAQAGNIKLREALETFAASENWQLNGVCDPNSGNFEGPSIASAALEQKP